MYTTLNANNARIIWCLMGLLSETMESRWPNVANPRRAVLGKNADCTRRHWMQLRPEFFRIIIIVIITVISGSCKGKNFRK
jgi:hypothetical protein